MVLLWVILKRYPPNTYKNAISRHFFYLLYVSHTFFALNKGVGDRGGAIPT